MASLVTSDNLKVALRVSTLAISGVWYGAGQYVSSVEVPARANLSTAVAKVDNFQQTFPRAKAMQGGLALLGALQGFALYMLDKTNPSSAYTLASSLCLLSLWPYTMVVIMPINNQLMAGEEPKKKNDSWINEMMDKWGRVHFVRTIVGGVAFALNIKAILM